MPDSPSKPGEKAHDPFALLALPLRFDLPDSAIESAFLARLGGVHPDLAGEDASLDAAALTHARATLADPEKRALALLQLLGGAPLSDEKALPPGFLMEMLELRERVQEQIEASPAARDRWTAFAAERREAHIARVAQLFSPITGAKSPTGDSLRDPAALRAIRVELNAWRYTERLIEQLERGLD